MLFGSIKVIVSVYIHIGYITDVGCILVLGVLQSVGCIRRQHFSVGSLQL